MALIAPAIQPCRDVRRILRVKPAGDCPSPTGAFRGWEGTPRMARLKAKDGANAVDYRRSLFLTTAIVTLLTAISSMQPASAQSVTGGGLADSNGNPISAQPSPWTVGGNLVVGQGSDGTLDIGNGGKV